jgi:ABC-2 type transport system ATP-binding protein
VDAIAVTALVKDYGGWLARSKKRALDHVTLRVPAGSAFGLIGPNGAGKTTLLKALLGVIEPSEGHVRVFEREPRDVNVRRRIGYLPERLNMPSAFTALAFLRSVARLKGVAQPTEDAERQLERVGLHAERGLRLGTFSKGMRQRLGLASALLGRPDLLVLDEPTDGIDPKGRADVRAILQEERARGATLFLNSHLLSETERICDRVGFLVAGKVLREGAMLELCGDRSRFNLRFAVDSQTSGLAALGFMPGDQAGAYTCVGCSVAELNSKLAQARESGAMLVELAPQMRDLEAVLLEVMEPRRA